MKVWKALYTTLFSIGYVLTSAPAKAQELSPQTVVDGVYTGIQHIHGYEATPKLIWDISPGAVGACGYIDGSQYCPRNHTIYITRQDIYMAYQHGDSAVAYLIAHEYAHAMQTAFEFNSRVTPISELQADCLAGVYIGLIPNIVFDNQDILEIASFAYRIGDYAWWSRHHHGTPKQRVQAVVIGLRGATNGKGVTACRL
ncbi:metalloprotease [Fischerella muscicola CCMEE 5323]|uniref:Metalloprotease n=1 Tax=Fischerella muscicola CCMEE 5323 TaxID=2019572 RepID=A0A2N6JW09_FISMU|nr:neutral zinc metallopeptidase [Fischerella muscicola]PLZ84101.1 metalloprotease [Fischerella muscicola CCMEE 5323]